MKVGGLERGLQQVHVGLELALRDERAAEALDRHVGQHKQLVEDDAEVVAQLALVVGLKLRLLGRQHGALRVVDQVDHPARARLAVAERIELLQAPDALVEHALAALAVDPLDRVARHRCDHLHALGGQEMSQVFLAGLEQDRQVAAVDHAHAHCARRAHQAAELLVQLGGAAGQVERFDLCMAQHTQHGVDRVGVHRLGAVRASVDVAVQAALVAAVAQVDLERGQAAAAQGGEVGAHQERQGGVHSESPGGMERREVERPKDAPFRTTPAGHKGMPSVRPCLVVPAAKNLSSGSWPERYARYSATDAVR